MSNKLTLHKDYRKLYKKYKYKYLGLKNMIGGGGAEELDKTNLPEDVVVKIGSYNTIVKVFAGAYHTMIMKTYGINDTVKVFACGDNYYGQLGLGNNYYMHTLTPICRCFAVAHDLLPNGVVIKQMVAGGDHTMIIAQDNMVFACGKNSHGQLGLGDTTNRNIFTRVMGDYDFMDRRNKFTADKFTAVPALPEGVVIKQVVAGERHTMILTEDGRVFACGMNHEGQLGLGDYDDRLTITEVTLPKDVVVAQIVAGNYHTMVITEDNQVFACGLRDEGQLGLGNYLYDTNIFTAVTPPENVVIKQVVAGGYHTMILADDGTVFACGDNYFGQLGLGPVGPMATFTLVTSLPENVVVAQIVAGRNHTMILVEDGTVFACGGNGDGQLGLGDNDNRDTFTAVPDLPEGVVAKQVIAGANGAHTMILANDGTMFACGSNEKGQLGLGDYENKNTFTPVPALPNEDRLRNANNDGRDE